MIPNKNTFCIAPYQHINTTPKGNLRICCASLEKPKYKYYDIKNWYESDILKSLRSNLEKGIKDPICNDCWKKEATGKPSQRQVYNKHIGKILENTWDKNFIKNKKLINAIENISLDNITSFDLALGNLCNLKCIMCNPGYSSQLLAEAKLNTELQEFHGNDLNTDYSWPETEQFKDWCKKFLYKSAHIKFTGGEPFMNPYLLETLESIPDEQKRKCILHFITNLTKINNKILNILTKFKETWLTVSVEGVGAVLEYARFGHKWQDLQKNLDTITKNKPNNLFVSIDHVIQSPTFVGITDLVNYFDNKKIKIEPLFLIDPPCFQILSIKTIYKNQLLDKLKKYNGYNITYINSLKKFIQKNIKYDENLAKQCVYRLQAFDKIRKNNFTKITPIDYFI
jgi:organic radical activating enzyme